MTNWTDFIKEWAAKHNLSYGCAMSDPALRTAYYKKFPKKESKKSLKKDLAKRLSKASFVDADGNEVSF
jgi:hypothetical protein